MEKRNKASKKWFVLCTKPRNEIKVATRLSGIGIKVYVPTRVETREWSDRKKKVRIPLLPSMILVCLLEKEVAAVFEVPGVSRFLFEHGKRASVLNEEVLGMQKYLKAIETEGVNSLAVGDSVKVPLLKEEATLISIKGKKCLAQLKKLEAVVSFQLQ